MLTDGEGRFRFEQSGQPATSLRLTKPGFSTAPEQADDSSTGVSETADPTSLTLELWPEAVLTGTVATPDGDPLPRISVLARRSVFDEQGHHLQIAGQTQTDSHGQFRIPVAAGDYVLETQFTQRGSQRGEAVLPSRFPPISSGSLTDVLHVGSGEEPHVELRPALTRTHVVTVPLEGGEGEPPRITARSADGLTFPVSVSRSQEGGQVRLNLPPGTYALHATRFSREGTQYGDSSVLVTDQDVTVSPLHLASLPSIPVELIADAPSTQTTSAGGVRSTSYSLPGVMQFNLVLIPVDPDPPSSFPSGFRLTQQREGGATVAAPPGVYRLNAGFAAGWYIRSATSRGEDLMRDTLLIAPGASPAPISIVVSNQTGAIEGAVTLSGTPFACWVYLVANGPTLPSIILRRSDAAGKFRFTDLPPGSYRAVAFPFRHSANLQNPSILDQFSPHVESISVSPGLTATLNLEAVPRKELLP